MIGMGAKIMADKKNNRRNNKDYDDDYRIKKIRKKGFQMKQ